MKSCMSAAKSFVIDIVTVFFVQGALAQPRYASIAYLNQTSLAHAQRGGEL